MMPSAPDDFDPEFDALLSTSPGDTIISLPHLSDVPTAYPDCCLALSAPLLSYLHSILPPSPACILSIGSGFGLLEACLLQEPYSLNIVGIEVQPSPNKYIPSAHHHCVLGTRFLDPLAAQAQAWIFVYPKRVDIVKEYLQLYDGFDVETIIWAGPQADWEDYKSCFHCKGQSVEWDVQTVAADKVGGRAWDLVAIAHKRDRVRAT